MNPAVRFVLPDVLVALLTVAFASVCATFVWQPGLASIADDSVSYLIMAQVFSPWQAVSQPVAEAFAREAFYPPLFPLLLGLAGAGHNMALAHAITAMLLAACLPVLYLLGIRWLGGRWSAMAVVAMTALLPSWWIHVKGILSEPLYCLMLLVTLVLLEAEEGDRARYWTTALAMTALTLTRTAALAMVVAYFLWALTRREQPLKSRVRAALPALAAAAAYAVWVLFRPAETSDANVQFLLDRIRAVLGAEHAFGALLGGLATQAQAIAEAWAGALVLFWVEGRPLRLVLAGAVGMLAVAGMVLRIAAGKSDGWMMAAYLATYLLWPYYDQMTRFLFPALPVLILYAFWTVTAGLRALGRPAAVGQGLLALLLISLAVPALAFIQQRASAGGRYAAMTDWYRTPDLAEARARVGVHLDLFADMEVIKSLTRPEHRVMWVVPSYVALLAERRGIRSPAAGLSSEAYRRAVLQTAPDYVFLSAYHPRNTTDDAVWRTGMQALGDYGEIVHARKRAGNAVVSSVLIKAPR